MTSAGSDSYLRQQLQQPSKAAPASPGLLMCAAGSSPPPAGSSAAWWRSSPPGMSATVTTNPSATLTRHIPVPQPPTRPSGHHLPLASPSKDKLSAAAGINNSNVGVGAGVSGGLTDAQPLNLSTRTPPPASQAQPPQQHHDIPTEA